MEGEGEPGQLSRSYDRPFVRSRLQLAAETTNKVIPVKGNRAKGTSLTRPLEMLLNAEGIVRAVERIREKRYSHFSLTLEMGKC